MNNNCRYTHTNTNFSPVPIFQGLHMHIISIKCENKCPQYISCHRCDYMRDSRSKWIWL